MSQKIYQVDSFTREPFAGNPAGVCLLEQLKSEAWMKAVAREMNLSETAFLVRQDDGSYHLRWFTPVKEVSLCGHATLASAHILWETGALAPAETARFATLSGELTAQLRGDWIEMNFPARQAEPVEPLEGLLEALKLERPLFVGKSNNTYVIEVQNEQIVRDLQPDFTRIGALPLRTVGVTARAGAELARTHGADFVSRYFAPSMGVNEDPVTGSLHCILTPYWAERLGKTELVAYQASARGGTLRVRAAGERVFLCGQAVTVLACDLCAD
jgi:PhzF family phenazine biosynthesis protein